LGQEVRKMGERKEIIRTANMAIYRGKDDLVYVEWPIPGYANNHGYRVEVHNDLVRIVKFCHGYAAGPCRSLDCETEVARIEDERFAKEVRGWISYVNKVEDFDWLKTMIEDRQKSLEEKAKAEFDELVEKFLDVAYTCDKRKAIEKLGDEEKLKELVREFLESKLEIELSE